MDIALSAATPSQFVDGAIGGVIRPGVVKLDHQVGPGILRKGLLEGGDCCKRVLPFDIAVRLKARDEECSLARQTEAPA